MSKGYMKIKKQNAEFMNTETYIYVYNMLKEYTINLFEWVNLPDTVDERFIENTLFESGYLCFFKDYDLDCHFALPCNLMSPFTIYGDPTRYKVFSNYNGYMKYRKSSTACIIYNNRLKKSTSLVARLFAQRISEAQRTMDVNIDLQKMAYIINADDDSHLTLQNFINKILTNEVAIVKHKDLVKENSVEVFKTDTPFIADKLMPYKRELLNEFFTYIGIDNANTDKKERMITDEISSNADQIEHARFNMLNARKQAVKNINKMFGLNIDVKFRETTRDKLEMAYSYVDLKNINAEANKFQSEADNQELTPKESEVVEDEPIHNNN